MEPDKIYSELCGAIHIHTRFSDGSVDFAKLTAAAGAVGLDYVIVTDHMSLEGKKKHGEGYYGKVLVLIGYEHNDSNDKNHYLAIGTDTVIQEQQSPQKYIHLIQAAGGIGFLAHPAEKRQYFERYPSYPWTDWGVEGYDGMELWNQMSEWVENLKTWGSFIRILYPRRFLKCIPPTLLKRWDDLNRDRFISGIGGVDAHTFKFKFGCITYRIFPIKVELKGIRTHLYVPSAVHKGDMSEAKAACLAALKNGNAFISNYRQGDARGTKLFLHNGDGKVVPPGVATHTAVFPAAIAVSIPARAEIRLVKNGIQRGAKTGMRHSFEISEEGIYRIEVFKGNKAWIYSNPFPLGHYPFR